MAHIVNILEAKTSLSQLVRQVESGAENEIIIARSGRPAARLVPLAPIAVDRSRRIGVAKGRFELPAPDLALDAEAQSLLEGSGR